MFDLFLAAYSITLIYIAFYSKNKNDTVVLWMAIGLVIMTISSLYSKIKNPEIVVIDTASIKCNESLIDNKSFRICETNEFVCTYYNNKLVECTKKG